jgi:hypothetical protein
MAKAMERIAYSMEKAAKIFETFNTNFVEYVKVVKDDMEQSVDIHTLKECVDDLVQIDEGMKQLPFPVRMDERANDWAMVPDAPLKPKWEKGKAVQVIAGSHAFFGWEGVIDEIKPISGSIMVLFPGNTVPVGFGTSQLRLVNEEETILPLRFGAGGPEIGNAKIRKDGNAYIVEGNVTDPRIKEVLAEGLTLGEFSFPEIEEPTQGTPGLFQHCATAGGIRVHTVECSSRRTPVCMEDEKNG